MRVFIIVALAVAIIATALVFFFVEDPVLQRGALCTTILVVLADRFRPKTDAVMQQTEQQANPGGDDKEEAAPAVDGGTLPGSGDDEATQETLPAVGSSAPPGSGDVTDELVNKFLNTCKFSGLECLFALEKACNGEPLQSRAIIAHMGQHFYGFFYGFVMATRAIGLIKFTASHGSWTVTRVDPRITHGLVPAILRRLGPKRRGPFKKLHEMLGGEWKESDWPLRSA